MPAPMQLPPGTPSEQAAALDAASFFALFFDTLRNNPPHANDGPMLDRMRRIGLDDRRPFNFGRLSPEVQQALADAQPLAGRRIADGVTRLGTPLNGWNTVLSGIGTYGTDYTRRASIAYAGLGAPTPDVLYPVTVADSRGARSIRTRTTCCTSRRASCRRPTRSGRCTSTTASMASPPIRQPLRAAQLDGLKYNADGSLDVYIQRRDPGERKRANWLSAPASDGPFLLSMRLYWPQDLALDGLWRRRRCDATEALAAQAGRAPRFNAARVFLVVAGSCARFGWGLEARGWAPLRGDFGWDES